MDTAMGEQRSRKLFVVKRNHYARGRRIQCPTELVKKEDKDTTPT